MTDVPRILQRAGWTWTDAGVLVDLTLDGQRVSVLVPLRRVQLEFDAPLRAIGCPIQYVGAVSSVGFFGALKKAVKKVGRAATKAVAKGARGVTRVAKRAGKIGLKVVRNKYFRAGMVAAAVAVPVLAPAAAAVETANQVINAYERGREVAKRVQRGIRSPGDAAKMALAVASEQAVEQVARKAQRGDRNAQRFIGGLEAAKAARARRRVPMRAMRAFQ